MTKAVYSGTSRGSAAANAAKMLSHVAVSTVSARAVNKHLSAVTASAQRHDVQVVIAVTFRCRCSPIMVRFWCLQGTCACSNMLFVCGATRALCDVIVGEAATATCSFDERYAKNRERSPERCCGAPACHLARELYVSTFRTLRVRVYDSPSFQSFLAMYAFIQGLLKQCILVPAALVKS